MLKSLIENLRLLWKALHTPLPRTLEAIITEWHPRGMWGRAQTGEQSIFFHASSFGEWVEPNDLKPGDKILISEDLIWWKDPKGPAVHGKGVCRK